MLSSHAAGQTFQQNANGQAYAYVAPDGAQFNGNFPNNNNWSQVYTTGTYLYVQNFSVQTFTYETAPSNWSTPTYPNSSSAEVNLGSNTVNDDVPVTVDGLTLSGGLTIDPGDTITANSVINSGAISLAYSSGAAGKLVVNSSLISNGGITTSAGSGNNAGGSVTVNGTFNQTGGSVTDSGSINVTGPTSINAGFTIIFGGGTFTSPAIAVGPSGQLIVNGTLGGSPALTDNGSITLVAATSGGILTRTLSSLAVGSTGTAVISAAHSSANRTLLNISSLNLAGTANAWTGLVNLANNDLDVPAGNIATLTNQIEEGFSNGTWQGVGGITSSSAAGDSTHLTALGIIVNGTTYGTAPGSLGTFDGINPAATDVLVKYTYFGDANLDGKVDGSDYSKIDSGFISHVTGWGNGDFNYDGVINGSDYSLIDNAFNSQGAAMTSIVATPTSIVSVPEPVGVGLLAIGLIGLVRRNSRRVPREC